MIYATPAIVSTLDLEASLGSDDNLFSTRVVVDGVVD
jgi:hypothetical protein